MSLKNYRLASYIFTYMYIHQPMTPGVFSFETGMYLPSCVKSRGFQSCSDRKKPDALRANRAVKVGAFRDVRTEKADVFTIRVDHTEKRDAFRANRTKTVDTSIIYMYYENQVRGIPGCV